MSGELLVAVLLAIEVVATVAFLTRTAKRERARRALARRKQELSEAIDRAARTIGLTLMPAIAGFATAAVKAAAEFDRLINAMSTDTSSEDMIALRNAALDLGRTTTLSATEAAQRMRDLR